MNRRRYVFVNWEKRDIVSTSSNPGTIEHNVDMEGKTTVFQSNVGNKAMKLFKTGYTYYGYYSGFDLTNIKQVFQL